MRSIINSKYIFWVLLSVPAILLLSAYVSGKIDSMEILHPTGEWAARLMIIAVMLSPMLSVFGPRRWINWLISRRRAIGVASFCYALLHLAFYVIDMGGLDDILAEWLAPGIWTGWAAFLFLIPVALTSNMAAMRALKEGWKRVQRLVYPAAILTMLHWIWVHNGYAGAFVHFLPLALLLIARYIKQPLTREQR
jgi:sulfoxide reductase heme-binding subunit YedZ